MAPRRLAYVTGSGARGGLGSRLIARLIAIGRARGRLRNEVGIWYHPGYVMPGLAATSRVSSLVLRRAELALGEVSVEGLVRERDIRVPPPASFADLGRVHPPDYLERVSEPGALAHIFGLPAGEVDTDAILAAQRRAVGGTLAAARAAAAGEVSTAFNLGGGFHHAEPEQGSGFCVYNDVAVAIRALRDDGFTRPIAVVDLDFHQGDGSLVTFAGDPTVLTYSLHGAVWTHVEAVANIGIELPSGTGDEAYLEALERTLPAALDDFVPALVFFLTGTDVLAGDPLGDFALTAAGVLRRDRFVVECARARGARLVMTLAGGYSPEAWRNTSALLRWLLTDQTWVSTRPVADLHLRMARIAASLEPEELQREPDDGWTLSEEEILGDLLGPTRRATRVLGYYSTYGVEYALERYGVFETLRNRGFCDLRMEIDPGDPERQLLRIRGRKGSGEHLLVELVVRRRSMPAPPGLEPPEPLHVLWLEWLLLQDPTASFTLEHPGLPGQSHPGLGMTQAVGQILAQSCRRLDLDGVVNHPSHFHIAVLGASAMRFLDPAVQGRFEALRRLYDRVSLGEASLSIDRGEAPFVWDPADLVLPVSERLTTYFASPGYRDAVAAAREAVLAR